MIGRLSGILFDKNPAQLLVDCNGVGYEVSVPMSTFYNLPSTGERVALLTHMVVREDAQLLYGFGTTQERELFRELIKISGISARTALAILSGMSVKDLAQAVTLQDAGRLTKIPGIGKKTAERLLLELKGKLGADIGARTALAVLSGLSVGEIAQAVVMQEAGRLVKIPGIGKKTAERLLLELKGKFGDELSGDVSVNRAAPARGDVVNALLGLGYSDKEAQAAVKSLPEGLTVSEGIRQALRALAKA